MSDKYVITKNESGKADCKEPPCARQKKLPCIDESYSSYDENKGIIKTIFDLNTLANVFKNSVCCKLCYNGVELLLGSFNQDVSFLSMESDLALKKKLFPGRKWAKKAKFPRGAQVARRSPASHSRGQKRSNSADRTAKRSCRADPVELPEEAAEEEEEDDDDDVQLQSAQEEQLQSAVMEVEEEEAPLEPPRRRRAWWQEEVEEEEEEEEQSREQYLLQKLQEVQQRLHALEVEASEPPQEDFEESSSEDEWEEDSLEMPAPRPQRRVSWWDGWVPSPEEEEELWQSPPEEKESKEEVKKVTVQRRRAPALPHRSNRINRREELRRNRLQCGSVFETTQGSNGAPLNNPARNDPELKSALAQLQENTSRRRECMFDQLIAKYENCSSSDDEIDINTYTVVKRKKNHGSTKSTRFSSQGTWNDTHLLSFIWKKLEEKRTK